MIVNCEFSGEEFDIPTEYSDRSSKFILCDFTHQQKNVLISNKGNVKKEDFICFGIETVPIQNDDEVEIVYCKRREIQQQDVIINSKLSYLKKNKSCMVSKPKHLACENEGSRVDTSKISSRKILETLFSK